MNHRYNGRDGGEEEECRRMAVYIGKLRVNHGCWSHKGGQEMNNWARLAGLNKRLRSGKEHWGTDVRAQVHTRIRKATHTQIESF